MSSAVPDSPAPASVPGTAPTSEERYQNLAENIPVQVWTSLPDGQLDYVTEQTASMFGLTVAVLLRDGWKDVVHPDDLPSVVEHWTRSLRTGEVYEVEFRLKLASGDYGWHLARAVPQRGPDGQIVRWLGTNTNIEAQREARRSVQALLDEVVQQSKESEALIAELRATIAQLRRRVDELERGQARP